MVRGAGCDEMILLLFGEVAFLGFGELLWVLGGCARTSHTPCPSQEGSFEMLLFYLEMRGLMVWRIPLLRGD